MDLQSQKTSNGVNKYVFAYYGEPKFDSPQAGMAYKQRWMAWMKDLGNAIVNPGVPTKRGKLVSASSVSDDESTDRVTGFSIIQAENMDAALAMAKKCPNLEHGTVNVAEAMEMKM